MRILKHHKSNSLFDEKSLVNLINTGKENGFRLLYKEYYRTLVIFGMNYINNKEVIEDIVQDVFLAIWNKNLRFETTSTLRNFLYKSVRNSCLNHIRKNEIEKKYIDSLVFDEWDEPDEQKLFEEEVYRNLFSVIDELPQKCREVFELHLEGKKNEDIADLLQISISTVKTQKNRAMNHLRSRMGDMFFILIVLNIV